MLLKALLQIDTRQWENILLAYQDGAKKISPKYASRFMILYYARAKEEI
jgi:hypothetical protein